MSRKSGSVHVWFTVCNMQFWGQAYANADSVLTAKSPETSSHSDSNWQSIYENVPSTNYFHFAYSYFGGCDRLKRNFTDYYVKLDLQDSGLLTACLKPSVFPEGIVWRLINVHKWCHLSQRRFWLKTTSLKVEQIWKCDVREEWALSVARFSSLLEATLVTARMTHLKL